MSDTPSMGSWKAVSRRSSSYFFLVFQAGLPDDLWGLIFFTSRPVKRGNQGSQGNSSVGTEELSHLEMVGTIVYQLTRNMTPEQIKAAGFDDYFVDHTAGVYPVAASGTPFNANTFSVTGDTIADLHENLSAEQKARMTYDNILRFTDDPDVRDPIKFLREREIVHFQRFGEANHTKFRGFKLPSWTAYFQKEGKDIFWKSWGEYGSFGSRENRAKTEANSSPLKQRNLFDIVILFQELLVREGPLLVDAAEGS
jgi:spore coat protein JC